ncbi:DUF29 domain-containing protein [Gloeocapsopsis crepidinum LEGE 06123]|uniref:DUF29 domain-containing protein n=1 Tax=Gloeocapsopsis crepidinum LEGE 06123 TaxID=588587 RepID=A0ABR9UXI9_9CHRO|nr:DUF29 domain-containing protein [Gloeocapsopsis crepidinum]MBE9192996.1 DUF29 domain-containing protein [Gloeocapsopsis crepidinum LEGE 06123]
MTDSMYSKDFVAWAEQQALILETEEFQKLDLANLVEEVRDMSRREIKAAQSHLVRLLKHLLKLNVQPDYPDKSWIISMKDARVELDESIAESTVLKNKLLSPESLARCYAKAVLQASNETDLPLSDFPNELPYSIEQILAADFFGK